MELPTGRVYGRRMVALLLSLLSLFAAPAHVGPSIASRPVKWSCVAWVTPREMALHPYVRAPNWCTGEQTLNPRPGTDVRVVWHRLRYTCTLYTGSGPPPPPTLSRKPYC